MSISNADGLQIRDKTDYGILIERLEQLLKDKEDKKVTGERTFARRLSEAGIELVEGYEKKDLTDMEYDTRLFLKMREKLSGALGVSLKHSEDIAVGEEEPKLSQ